MVKKEISIIIPAYNEEKNIESTIGEIRRELKGKKFNYEIVVVDDGSTDNTCDKVKTIKDPNIRLIRFVKNKGKGEALKAGLLAANEKLRLYTDADNSTSITHLFDFLPHIQGYDIIIGSRGLPKSKIDKRQPFYKEILGKSGNLLIRKILKLSYADTQCGFKLFTKEAVEKVIPEARCSGWGFDFEILKIAEIKKIRVKELPITWKNSPDSAVGFFDYFKTLKSLLKIKKRYD